MTNYLQAFFNIGSMMLRLKLLIYSLILWIGVNFVFSVQQILLLTRYFTSREVFLLWRFRTINIFPLQLPTNAAPEQNSEKNILCTLHTPFINAEDYSILINGKNINDTAFLRFITPKNMTWVLQCLNLGTEILKSDHLRVPCEPFKGCCTILTVKCANFYTR